MTDYVANLGKDGWQRNEALDLARNLRTEATITDGVIKWNATGSVPPEDLVALAVYMGMPVDVAACDAERSRELSLLIEQYRRSMANRTIEEIEEQRAAARAAHGRGVTLVNVLTGEKYTT